MGNSSIKQAALDLVQNLPDDCTWDDVMYRVYVRQKIEEGRRDIEEGRTIPHEQVLAEFANASDSVDSSGTKTSS